MEATLKLYALLVLV